MLFYFESHELKMWVCESIHWIYIIINILTQAISYNMISLSINKSPVHKRESCWHHMSLITPCLSWLVCVLWKCMFCFKFCVPVPNLYGYLVYNYCKNSHDWIKQICIMSGSLCDKLEFVVCGCLCLVECRWYFW